MHFNTHYSYLSVKLSNFLKDRACAKHKVQCLTYKQSNNICGRAKYKDDCVMITAKIYWTLSKNQTMLSVSHASLYLIIASISEI